MCTLWRLLDGSPSRILKQQEISKLVFVRKMVKAIFLVKSKELVGYRILELKGKRYGGTLNPCFGRKSCLNAN